MTIARAVRYRHVSGARLPLALALLVAAGCVGWIPPQREVALQSASNRALRITNATTAPIDVLPALDRAADPAVHLSPGETTTVRFSLYKVIPARLLQPTTLGWRADTAGEATLRLLADGPVRYLDMDGVNAALRVRTAAGEEWVYHISLDDCLFNDAGAGGYDLKVDSEPDLMTPIELCH